jgi:hypothetical protein
MFHLIREIQRQSYKQMNRNDHPRSYVYQTKAHLEDRKRQGSNIIFSSKHFSSKLLHWNEDDSSSLDDNIFRNNLKWLLKGLHVQVIIAYRHYVEWLPGMYFQQHRQDKRYIEWEDKGGLSHPSFWEWVKRYVDAWGNEHLQQGRKR